MRKLAAVISGQTGVWIGVLAAGIAVLAGFLVQFASLRELYVAAPLANRAALEDRLRGIAADVQTVLGDEARRVLSAPASVVVPYSEDDDVAAAFASAPAEGVRRYFICSIKRDDRRLKVTLYDPATRTVGGPDSIDTQEFGLARNGSITWLFSVAQHLPADPQRLAVFESNPRVTVVTRAIVDDESRIVGVAGMLVDSCRYRDDLLPGAFAAAVARGLGPTEIGDVALTLRAADGTPLSPKEEPGGEPVASARFDFPSQGLTVEARPRSRTFAQAASRQFAIGIAQAALVCLLFAAGVALTARAARQETRLLRMKNDFLSNVTHELRSPLTSIRLYGELLRSGRVADRHAVEECGEYIEREGRRLEHLVANVLDFAKLDAGRRIYTFREVDLARIAAEAADAVRPQFERARMRLDLFEPDAPLPPVAADADAMRQAVLNLLDNAAKYSNGAERAELRLGVDDGVFVEVVDFGVGIPRDERDRVFERFHRVGTGLAHDVKGTGIGLAIVKSVVEAHRGRVSVESEVGRGSTFRITLPAMRTRPSASSGETRREDEHEEAADCRR